MEEIVLGEEHQSHGHDQGYVRDSVVLSLLEQYRGQLVFGMHLRFHYPGVRAVDFRRQSSRLVEFALGESAGFGSSVLWKLKMLFDWLLLAVGPGEERGFRSYLSIHRQLAE